MNQQLGDSPDSFPKRARQGSSSPLRISTDRPFDPCGYDYGNHLGEFAAIEALFGLAPDSLEDIRKKIGGKGVSLEISRLLKNLDRRLMVPEQFTDFNFGEERSYDSPTVIKLKEWFEKIPKEDLHILEGVIIRTSNIDEDWIDPRCGVGDSVKFETRGDIYDFVGILKILDEKIENGEKCVIQPLYDGLGYVADVAYSEVLKRPVVHIARGGSYENGYTSATEDLDASHYICDLESGELIAPAGEEVFFGKSCKRILKILQKAAKIGFRFGFQVEINIHPRNPDVIRLLQFRPSPDRLRPQEDLLVPEAVPSVISTRVSGCGRFRGETLKRQQRFSMKKNRYEEECLDAFISAYFDKPKSTSGHDFTNRLVPWDIRNVSFVNQRKMFVGAAFLGASVQISTGATFHANRHGGFYGYKDYEREAIFKAMDSCLYVGLNSGEFNSIYGRPGSRSEEEFELEVVSDGLVAAIYKHLT